MTATSEIRGMLLPFGLPDDICKGRSRGNRNSAAANRRVFPLKASTRERIRVYVAANEWHGATLKELAESFHKPVHTLSGRVSELKALRHIFDSGREREHCAVLVGESRWCNGGTA